MNPLTGFLPLLLLSSCTVGPNYTAPDAPGQARFRSKAAGAVSAPASEGELASWWRRLGDARLNGLVEQAIAGNRDIKSAIASIKSVRALRNAARFDSAPIVTAGTSYSNARSPRTGTLPGAPRDSESYDIGFDATWELDLFGRVRRNVEAASADLAAAEAVRDDLLVSVTAETARAYMELCGLHYQLRVAKENAANQRSSLDITTRLLEGGRGTGLDVSRAQAQYSTTLATIPQIEAAADRACHRLAVLTGQTPDTLRDRLKPATLPARFPSIHLGDPASLLRRRPDIRAAERQLAAATARIGVAMADLFPRITFNGSVGSTAGSLRRDRHQQIIPHRLRGGEVGGG
ncbi:MAG TPA: efflux transporter outer membrane subunit, partial [Verrucomicrobiales bacterium]|nr:efflux transporter outer membrane subunit [Verrucomicrobiales bacterium]